jgi:hypothetical protein
MRRNNNGPEEADAWNKACVANQNFIAAGLVAKLHPEQVV